MVSRSRGQVPFVYITPLQPPRPSITRLDPAASSSGVKLNSQRPSTHLHGLPPGAARTHERAAPDPPRQRRRRAPPPQLSAQQGEEARGGGRRRGRAGRRGLGVWVCLPKHPGKPLVALGGLLRVCMGVVCVDQHDNMYCWQKLVTAAAAPIELPAPKEHALTHPRVAAAAPEAAPQKAGVHGQEDLQGPQAARQMGRRRPFGGTYRRAGRRLAHGAELEGCRASAALGRCGVGGLAPGAMALRGGQEGVYRKLLQNYDDCIKG